MPTLGVVMHRFLLLLVAALGAPLVGCSAQRAVEAPVVSCALVAGSPLEGAQIGAVRPLVATVESENKKVAFTRVVGAELVVIAPSVTPEELEHRARCHAPRAVGPDDPLGVAGVSVRVKPESAALALQITSTDPAAAREILSRAQRLAL